MTQNGFNSDAIYKKIYTALHLQEKQSLQKQQETETTPMQQKLKNVTGN